MSITVLVRYLMYNTPNRLDRSSIHSSFLYGIPAAWNLLGNRLSYVLVSVANGQQLLTLRLTANLSYVIKHWRCADRDLYSNSSSHIVDRPRLLSGDPLSVPA
jgi:hypothetical protein